MRISTVLSVLLVLLCAGTGLACAQTGNDWEKAAANGKAILPDAALFRTGVGGLERTSALQQTIAVTGQRFEKALRITIQKDAPDSNATQLTIPNVAPVTRGETLLATFYLRGRKADGKSPAELMFLFERSTSPWTKSISQMVTAAKNPGTWKPVRIVFGASEDYQPGQVMASLRFAFGSQTIEVADLKVVSLGTGKTLEEIYSLSEEANPLADSTVTVNTKTAHQTMLGLGGNFCQARYGRTERNDPVGEYTLNHLNVAVARVGLPLNFYTPEPGVYKDDGQAQAAFEMMREMAKRKIPLIASVWEGPLWMLPGKTEENGRVLSPDKYDACIQAIVRFLVTARDRYNAPVAYFSFNEADYGVNFKFSPAEMGDFIRKAGPQFKAAGLKTTFLTADTANGNNLAGYAAPLLADPELRPFLGPIAFHSWDALTANEKAYTAIAALGKQYQRPVWCTEAGHDAQLWQQPNPWASWENALRLSTAYARTVRLTDATTLLYWTYQDNYPLVTEDGKTPYAAFQAIQLMETVFARGATVLGTSTDNESLQAVATRNADDKGVKLLLVNSAGAGKVTIKGMPAYRKVTYNALKSNEDANSTVTVTDKKGVLTVQLPARSVTVVSLN